MNLFRGKKIRFVTALDLIKCIQHIKQQRLLLTCAPILDLPTYMSTMGVVMNEIWPTEVGPNKNKEERMVDRLPHGTYRK